MKWLSKLKEYAPDIAGAILSGGATLPSLALKAVSDATGHNITNETELAQAVESASPEVMLKVKQAENSFKIRMKELSNELESAEIGDIQNARHAHKDSKMPAFICIFLTVSVVAFGASLMIFTIPESNLRLVDTLFGAVLTAWLGSLAFFNGTTRSSSRKTEALVRK